MKRRDFLTKAGAGAALGAMAAPAIAQSTPSVKWRLQTSWPKSLDTTHGGVEAMAKRIFAITEGKFDIQVLTAGSIVPGNQVFDAVETSEADIQEDIELALIQMKAETLNKVDDALARLEQSTYGNCFECGDEIAEKRLRALPFAVRCKDCEAAKEAVEQRHRQLTARRGASSLFFDI